ncbi:glycosyltransferase family 2 protein [Agrobacterium rosae]|uniref:Glycosyltransferase family 2 protein n=1 Tax=Agrobacterium rosae TaxID=1972867 RepID=A0AAW9FHQ8_9HYPH|nr:glycosyltransferase family 2 protein [Agrobacterium rosae]MDX8303104.1 glycosyltransferase family 2 protein [Agrobacterium rosae]POO56416.1 glucosyll transferase [Agrobacterium rosae]
MQSVEALIFMTGRNCAQYAARAVQSIAKQTLKDVHILFVDDKSDDETAGSARQALEELFPGKHTLISNDTRFGKARNAWEHLRPLSANAKFIGVVDADDQLIEPRVLEAMLAFYNAGKDVVWTNFAMDNGHVGCNTALDPAMPPRQQGWKTSHFFSFRAELLGNVPEEYFQDSEGAWLQAACDIALAMPILDQTRRYQFLGANAYLYTATNPQSHHNLDSQSVGLNSTIQQKSAQEVFRKTPLPLTRPVLAEAAPQPEAVAAKPKTNVPTGPSSMTTTVSTQTWSDITGNLVVAETPGIINAMAYCGPTQLSPEQVWALRGIVSTRQDDANVLHVGSTRSALALACLLSGTARQLTCLCASNSEAEELDIRLRLCGTRDEVTISVAEPVNINFDQVSGSFPDTRNLDPETKFDMVVVDFSKSVPQTSAIVSLSALAPNLAPRGFALCLMVADKNTEALAATKWGTIGSGLRFCVNAIGGSGLLVVGGQ